MSGIKIDRELYANLNTISARNRALCKSLADYPDISTENWAYTEDYPVSPKEKKFVRVMGITRFWDENESLDSNALISDLLSGLHKADMGFIYFIKGSEESIELYIGIDEDCLQNLKSILVSVFPAIELIEVTDVGSILPKTIQFGGIASGIPSNKMKPEDKNKRLQIDQILRGLYGKNFVYMVLATAIEAETSIRCHDEIMDEMTAVSEYLKENKTLANEGITYERQSFVHIRYFDNLKQMEEMYNNGTGRGMWYASILFGTYGERELTYDDSCVANLIKATFSGIDSRPENLRTIRGIPAWKIERLMQRFETPGTLMPDCVNHLLGDDASFKYMTVIDSDHLAVMTAMPGKEYPGYYIDDYVEFDSANRTLGKLKNPIKIGSIRQAGRGTTIDENNEDYNPYFLEKDDYTRHCLIIGITGGGKTNTSKSLLRTLWLRTEPRVPFLVIESAKREYWELRRMRGFEDLMVYTLGSDDVRTSVPYRLNPFETFPGISLQTHIDSVLATFKAAFEMTPPMPYVLENAVFGIYEDRGWNIITSENDLGLTLYPTISDLYDKIGFVVDSMGYHHEVASNIRSALEARVHSLMIGGKGAMLNTPKSVPIGELLNTPTVLELEDIGDDETKSFVIGILMTQLYEYRKANMGVKGGAKTLKHILMIEEAHRLLKNVKDTGSSQAKSVEFFCNMLAEIRTYGQGIFIADQVPTKLAPDTLKNTNLKIVHRTVAKEDREFVGHAMNMTDAQIEYLSSLRRGYAAVYAEGDNSPKYVKLPYVQDDPSLKKMTRTDIIKDVQNRIGGSIVQSDFKSRHCGCTYCEMQFRCRYYDEMHNILMKKRPGKELDYGTEIAISLRSPKVAYEPARIVRIFNTVQLKNYDFNIWQKNCFLGQVLETCTDLHNGKRKYLLSRVLRIMCEELRS